MRNRPIDVPTDEIQSSHALGDLEHICELRKSSSVLYGIFTELVRLIYSDKDGRLIGTPNVVWTPKGTSIWIDTELRWEDQHPEARPAIYVQLGPIQSKPYIEGANGKVTPANRFAERRYALASTGTVNFVHVAHTAGEACALADNTEYALSMMQGPICNDFCFTQFVQAGRTPLEKLPKESVDRIASAVSFRYEFDEVWLVKEETPILKSIDFLYREDGGSRQATVIRDNIFTETTRSGTSQT